MTTKIISKQHALKQEVIDSIKEKVQKAKALVLIEFKGLTVIEDTALRNEFRKNGVEYKVLKNTLIKRALNDLNYNQFDNSLNGTTSVAFSYQDEVIAAKILTESAKKLNDKVSVKCGLVSGVYIDNAQVKALAALPSREILISKMLGSMNAPITKFAGVLNATLTSLVYAIKAVHDKKAEA